MLTSGGTWRNRVRFGRVSPTAKLMTVLTCSRFQFATVALVGGGGIVEAVADDDLAGREGGADDFAHELGAAGIHEQQLGLGGHGMIGLAVLEGVPDLLADGRAARLAQGPDAVAERLQAVGQQLHLCGFCRSPSVPSNEMNKPLGIFNLRFLIYARSVGSNFLELDAFGGVFDDPAFGF